MCIRDSLGTPPPRPPANVPPLDENEHGEATSTMRERLALHRASPACASCHRIMDPLGFALENFDPIGAWRTRDSGTVIDASDSLFDGTAVDGPSSLRQYLEKSEDLFVGNFARNLMMFALGRVLQPTDMAAVRRVAHRASTHDNEFSAFVLGIVSSPPFMMRQAEALATN